MGNRMRETYGNVISGKTNCDIVRIAFITKFNLRDFCFPISFLLFSFSMCIFNLRIKEKSRDRSFARHPNSFCFVIRCFSENILDSPTNHTQPTAYFSIFSRDVHSVSCLIKEAFYSCLICRNHICAFIGWCFMYNNTIEIQISWSQFSQSCRILLIISINKELRNRQSCCLSIF